MPTCRDVLNKMKWHTRDLGQAEVVYRHRGAPNDEKAVSGLRIRELASWYFLVEDEDGDAVQIPYHRILRISARGAVVWDRAVRIVGEAE